MNLRDYFTPVSIEKPAFSFVEEDAAFSHHIDVHTANHSVFDLASYRVALIGVPAPFSSKDFDSEDDNPQVPDCVRQYLFQLVATRESPRIIDLGDLRVSEHDAATYAALREVLIELLQANVLPVIIGGAQHLEYAVFKAYQYLGKRVNICSIDSSIDALSDAHSSEPSTQYIQRILSERENNLFQYAVLGCQSYFLSPAAMSLFEKEKFEVIKIAALRSHLPLAEPPIRDANIVSVDMGAVRFADSPGTKQPMANGLYGEEITRLVHYAGRSESVSVLGLFEMSFENDPQKITASLAAELIWYYLEGVVARVSENLQSVSVKKIVVELEDVLDQSIVFYTSTLTERWWMEVPSLQYDNMIVVACSPEDYQAATRNELPARWWRFYQKIN